MTSLMKVIWITAISMFFVDASTVCTMESGYCVLSDGVDQNSGLAKLNSLDIDTEEAQADCLEECLTYPSATGCEGIWAQYNSGCYVHTATVDHGNDDPLHVCWIFSKCTEEDDPTNSPTMPPTSEPTSTLGDPFIQWTSDTGCHEVMTILGSLALHYINCGSSVLSSYGMLPAEATICSYPNREIEFTCIDTVISSSETRYSPCKLGLYYDLQFLDRQEVSCNDNEVLSSWRLTQGDCNDGDGYVQYTCSTVGVAGIYTVTGDCQRARFTNISYLDRHLVSCGENEAISAVTIAQGDCRGWDMRFEWTCSILDCYDSIDNCNTYSGCTSSTSKTKCCTMCNTGYYLSDCYCFACEDTNRSCLAYTDKSMAATLFPTSTHTTDKSMAATLFPTSTHTIIAFGVLLLITIVLLAITIFTCYKLNKMKKLKKRIGVSNLFKDTHLERVSTIQRSKFSSDRRLSGNTGNNQIVVSMANSDEWKKLEGNYPCHTHQGEMGETPQGD